MKMRMASVALLALLVAAPAMGQMVEKQIYFGIKGGVNMANLSVDPEPDEDFKSRMGIVGGASLSFVISPGMTLDTDFLLVQRGAKVDEKEVEAEDGLYSLKNEIKLSYLSINPMFRFTVQNEGMAPYFMAGPEISFLLSANAEGEERIEYHDGEVEVEEWDEDIKDYVKSTDFGLNFGAGLQFPSGNSSIFFEARYYLGLSDISDDSGDEDDDKSDDEEEDEKIKNTGIYLIAGIRF
ncbi:MAG: PorT family protein [Candidatus Eisenbacteria sp.]|nr:PorT family protein [Candidatus Eisenbacteria bacterium]